MNLQISQHGYGGSDTHITIEHQRGATTDRLQFTHKDILKLELLLQEAKHKIMMGMDRKHWHEISPEYAK
jgi:hypothetical protein